MNADATEFALRGHYRVQGSASPEFGRLEGQWMPEQTGLLTDAQMNAELSCHARWQGRTRCSVRAARVRLRSGQFESRPDILYKMSHFVASDGTPPMPCNIVDLPKARLLWHRRTPILSALFGVASFEAASRLIGDLDRAIVNEYVLHEAGHCLGYSVEQKTADRYFAPGGEPSAILIALEELRADAHGFQLALKTLTASDAVSVFVYYIAQRFGVHVEGLRRDGTAPYGLIPYLLFDVLQAAGFAIPHGTGSSWPSPDTILRFMRHVASYIDTTITVPEIASLSPVDAAMVCAAYVRRRVLDARRAEQFQRMVDEALRRVAMD
jgi:hypothetical protein